VTPGAVTLLPALFTNTNTFYSATVTPGAITLLPALFTNTNTFYSPTVASAYTIAPALFVNTNTFYTAALSYDQVIEPALFVNTNAFYNTFAYLYPFHPNDVRPGGSSVVPGPRGPMPPAPNAARGAMPLSTSVRQPMPFQ
jgi:hypothetical protein